MVGFNYNPNFYLQDLQAMRDRIDRTIQQHQQSQYQQPMQPITQNFQIAPAQYGNDLEGRYANNIDEVRNTFVVKTGIFTTKDYSTIWVKDVSGNIKTYKTEEVIELDEKDRKIKEQDNTIASLQAQINELKGAILNATNHDDNANAIEPITTKKSSGISNNTKSSK